MIKAIIFDVWGCYMQWSFVNFVNKSYKILWINELFKTDNEIAFDSDFNKWHISGEECFRKYFKVPISDSQMQEIKKIWTSTRIPTEEMINLIKSLKNNWYTLAILSNSDLLNAENFKKKWWYSYFDYLVLSHEVWVIKPEKKIYKLILDKLILPAEECIFIDDQKDVLIPAKEMGMTTIHFIWIENLKLELVKNNIKI